MKTFELDSADPRVMYIPAMHVNSFAALLPETRVMFFSTTTLEESKQDDYRYPAEARDLLEDYNV